MHMYMYMQAPNEAVQDLPVEDLQISTHYMMVNMYTGGNPEPTTVYTTPLTFLLNPGGITGSDTDEDDEEAPQAAEDKRRGEPPAAAPQ